MARLTRSKFDQRVRLGRSILDNVEGYRDEATGRFYVTNWPTSKWPNPNFLTEKLNHFKEEEKSK